MRQLLALLLLPAVGAALRYSRPAAPPQPVAAGRVPVAVELFTSEGCSSCPAADAVLRELAATQPVPGVQVVALGEHVDYWNRLGWVDPFSAAQFSARQRGYARRFGAGSYTPQAVVAGRYELVGSRRAELLQRIAEAARAPQATVELQPSSAGLAVRVAALPAGTRTAEVELALTEAGLSTQVGTGENAGLLLRHAPVVRSLRLLGTARAGTPFVATAPVQPSPAGRPGALQAVVLVRDAATQQVVGTASLPVAPAAAAAR